MSLNETTRCDSDMEMSSDKDLTRMESMLTKEQTVYAQHDYFARPLPISPRNEMPVDTICRQIMAKWCTSLCKFCNYDRRMVGSVMSCVDRFVATPEGFKTLLSRDEYQLVVMASLYLVAKIQQTQALEPESVAKLSRGKYSKENIEDMELRILCSLGWFVHPPTAMSFAHEFLENFDLVPQDYDDESSISSTSTTTEQKIMDLVRCQVEEATFHYELCCLTRPSHVAYAALSNALESLSVDSSNAMKALKQHLKIADDAFISSSLLEIVSSSEDSELSSLLLHGTNSANKENQNEGHKTKDSPLRSRPSSSSITASPRTVVA